MVELSFHRESGIFDPNMSSSKAPEGATGPVPDQAHANGQDKTRKNVKPDKVSSEAGKEEESPTVYPDLKDEFKNTSTPGKRRRMRTKRARLILNLQKG